MDANGLLTQFTIATPCPMEWERMTGDDRVRFCERCGKHVYDLTAMSPDETPSLASRILSDGEDLCGRMYQRPDGTLVASDCRSEPVGGVGGLPIRSLMAALVGRPPASSRSPAAGVRSTGARQFTIRWLITVIAACATALGLAKTWLISPDEPAPTRSMSRSFPIIMGKMAPRRIAPPATGAPSCPATASPDSGASG